MSCLGPLYECKSHKRLAHVQTQTVRPQASSAHWASHIPGANRLSQTRTRSSVHANDRSSSDKSDNSRDSAGPRQPGVDGRFLKAATCLKLLVVSQATQQLPICKQLPVVRHVFRFHGEGFLQAIKQYDAIPGQTVPRRRLQQQLICRKTVLHSSPEKRDFPAWLLYDIREPLNQFL